MHALSKSFMHTWDGLTGQIKPKTKHPSSLPGPTHSLGEPDSQQCLDALICIQNTQHSKHQSQTQDQIAMPHWCPATKTHQTQKSRSNLGCQKRQRPLPHKHRSFKTCFSKPKHFSFNYMPYLKSLMLTWNGHSLPNQAQANTKPHTHTPSAKTSRVTVAISNQRGYKQPFRDSNPEHIALLWCTIPCGRKPPPQELSPQFIFLNIHEVVSFWRPFAAQVSGDFNPSPSQHRYRG